MKRWHTQCFLWARWFLSMAILWSASHGAFADSLQAIADRDSIGVDETLNFKLVYNGQRASGDPDLTALTQQFDVLSNQKSTQTSIVNNSVSASTEWHFVLSPKSTGQLLIPPFTVDGQHSQPLTITVKEGGKDPVSGTEDVFLEAYVDKSNIFVQEQFLVTLRLYYDRNVDSLDAQPLAIDNVRLETLPRADYQKTIGHKNYRVAEFRYAGFADASGTISVPAQNWTVRTTDDPNMSRFGFSGGRYKLYRIKSQELSIAVAPRPAQYPSSAVWLPAQEVVLEEYWSQSPETVKVGEPITRTLTVKAIGAAAESIPPVFQESASADFKFYPDKPNQDKQLTERGVIGTRTESVAIVPNRNGDLLLPAVKVTWWNTDRKQVEEATIPARTIRAVGSAPIASTPVGATEVAPLSPEAPTLSPTTPKTPWTWIGLAGVSLLGNLALIAILVFRKAPSSPASPVKEAEEASANELVKRVQLACDQRSPEALRKAILDWAKQRWGTRVNSLTKVGELSDDPKLIAQLRLLDSALFGEGGNAIDYAEIKAQLNALKKRPSPSSAANTVHLKPLYASR